MSARPTLKSVAQAAGVSTATVSYAFNRPDRLSAEARARVLAVARDLGYAGPDAAARSLRTGRAGAIGVILTVELTYAFTDPYVLALLGGLSEFLEHTRTSLVLIPLPPTLAGLDDDGVRESLDAVHRAVIDGAVADGLPADHPAVRALAARSVPLVRSWPTATDRWVGIDDRAAGHSVGRHLADLGHRDVAVVVACQAEPGRPVALDHAGIYPYSRERLAGIREGLGERSRVRVLSGGRNTAGSGRTAAQAALSLAGRPTAIAADSDVLALAIADAVRANGLTIGRDVSVTGFDDAPAADAAGLTTVRQPVHEKGRLMGRMLLDPSYSETQVVLPTELVVRSSTGRVPRNQKGE